MNESRFYHKDNKLAQSYLKAFAPFGVSGYPSVFKQDYAPVWAAFKREFKTDTKDKTRLHLYQILMFVLYCRDLGIEVVQKGFKADPHAKSFDPQKMLDTLYYYDLKGVCDSVKQWFVRSRLAENLQVFQRKSIVVNDVVGKGSFLSVCILRPLNSRHKLFDVLTGLKSMFGSDVPVQLLPKKNLPSYQDLINPRSTNGWLAVNTQGVKVTLHLADKEYLVVKTLINIGKFDDVWVPPSKKVATFINKQKIL